jgi:hypothetical protein
MTFKTAYYSYVGLPIVIEYLTFLSLIVVGLSVELVILI